MTARDAMLRLYERGVLSPLDVQLADALRRIGGEASGEVMLGAALASRAVQHGHVCADLRRICKSPLLDAHDAPVIDIGLPKLGPWLTALSASRLVSHRQALEDGGARTPLVMDDAGRLYLHRYFDYERRLAEALAARAERQAQVDEAVLAQGLSRLFPVEVGRGADDAQRRAALVALRRRLCVISGGPGTGKTTTVVRILALIQEQAIAAGKPCRMLLLAPTGKAAQRLKESIALRIGELATSDAVKAAIPRDASTIHRALGYQPATPTRFRRNRESPLAADVVIADEASMIDLALMTKLVEAVAPGARLILLGDRDQLASVEAGAILGDLYPDAAREARPLGACLAELDRSYRFSAHSGIGALTAAIKRDDPEAVMQILRGDAAMPYGEVAMTPLDEERPLAGDLGRAVSDGYRALLSAGDPEERLAALGQLRVLCAHRHGRLGVDSMNAAIEQHLERQGALRLDAPHYDGRPIIVTRNDHQLGLFNGDVGVICKPRDGAPTAYFHGHEGIRALPVSRLPPHETVFAMTVHKSQGSEMDRIALVLPSRPSPILTRELVYTAVSRARRRVDIHGAEHVLRHAIGRRIERASGLRDALW